MCSTSCPSETWKDITNKVCQNLTLTPCPTGKFYASATTTCENCNAAC